MRGWKRDAPVIYLYVIGNPRSWIYRVCEMKRARYVGNKLQFIDIGARYPREFVPDCPQSEIRKLFREQWNVLYTCTCTRIPGVARVNARVLMQIHGRYLTDIDSSYVGRVTRNCRTHA